MAPIITGRVYPLNEASEWMFRTIFPDLEPDAKYILLSSEGMMTFEELPPAAPMQIRFPHIQVLSYYDIEFEDE